MTSFVPRVGVPSPGINVNIGPESVPFFGASVPGPSYLPNNGPAMETLAASMNYGLPTGTETSTPFFLANDSINYSYTCMPWNDETEKYIQENMLVFACKHVDNKTQGAMTNVVPIFKLNELLRKKNGIFDYNARNNPAGEEGIFQGFLSTLGESLISEYDHHLRHNPKTAQKLADKHKTLPDAHKLALSETCRYETLFGITSRWNFLGAVVSKGESTGAGSYMDNHAHTQQVIVVGVALAKRARVHNIWPDVKNELVIGSKLFLVLRRQNGEPGRPFQYEPRAYRTRDGPPDSEVFYTGTDKRSHRGHVLSLGFVWERSGNKADGFQQQIAIGTSNHSIQDAAKAMATLPQLYMQIGM